MSKETKDILVGLAESVRGEVLFDLEFKVDSNKFFRTKFDNDNYEKIRLSSLIYKHF